MSRQPSFQEIKKLSLYLDGQLSSKQETRLEEALRSDPRLLGYLTELSESRRILRQTPVRRVPHNFTLSPNMAGVKPPVPLALPVFRFASVIAAVLLFFSFMVNLVGPLQASPNVAMAPRSAAVETGCQPGGANDCAANPSLLPPGVGYGGGQPEATTAPTDQGVMAIAGAATATETPAMLGVSSFAESPSMTPTETLTVTPTETATVPTATSEPTSEPPATKTSQPQVIPTTVLVSLAGLFVLFGVIAMGIWLVSVLRWRKQK